MEVFKVLTIVALAVFFLAQLFFAIKSHRFWKTLIFNAFLGICTLAIIDLTAKFSGAYIPLNPYSVGFSAAFGIPAVCLLLLLQIIII